jgi:hypothetical protein
MAKLPRFAKVFAGRWRIVEMDYHATFANAAEFFNSLLALLNSAPQGQTGASLKTGDRLRVQH